MKRVWLAAGVFMLLFFVILEVRYDFIKQLASQGRLLDDISLEGISARNTWMNLYLKNEKIGYSHSALSKTESGFRLEEKIFMRMNIMGFSQDLAMATTAGLNPDLSINTFDFKLNSGIFSFSAAGQVKDMRTLSVTATLAGTPQQIDIPLKQPLYLTSALLYAVFQESKFSSGDQIAFYIFDPATMTQEKAVIHVAGDEEISYSGKRARTTKLIINYKGSTETAWMDETGDILREEGMLGMTLVKTTAQDAYAGLPDRPAEDITRLASVPADKLIENPRKTVFLKIRLSGIDTRNFALDGGRQKLEKDVLEISQEKIPRRQILRLGALPMEARNFLKSEPFIEADHPKIRQTVEAVVSSEDPPHQKAKKIIRWMNENISQRPVLSIPDALSTLENRVGDCNEHAVLFAALARAAGIPAKIEAGLVYLDGRFYYHAWNLVYVGVWVTADSAFGQFPADATHIRFVSGSPADQMNLMPVVDRVGISILEDREVLPRE
ncbi:MAG: transglutaminase domain-containing protein [Desulfobacterales bacterium]|nr:transglutaminase domain-containing protein [Desulfobacterales bacterium]